MRLPAERPGRALEPAAWRRAVAYIVLLLTIGGLVYFFSYRVPREVRLEYVYGDEPPVDLRQVVIEMFRADDGQMVRRSMFNYPAAAAPAAQRHTVRLAPGDYRFDIRLRYGAIGQLPGQWHTRRVTRKVEITGGDRLSIYLPALR